MTDLIHITTIEELEQHFKGVMIPVEDIAGSYRVPGWECKTCGWTIGSKGYPPAHHCPGDGWSQGMLDEDTQPIETLQDDS